MSNLIVSSKGAAVAYNALVEMLSEKDSVTLAEWRDYVKRYGMERNRFFEARNVLSRDGFVDISGEHVKVLVKIDGTMEHRCEKKKEKKPRGLKGNAPKGDEWKTLGEIGNWLVFFRINEGIEWITLKVVSKTREKRKANFWLGWNRERFANSIQMKRMVDHQPQLLEDVRKMVLEKL